MNKNQARHLWLSVLPGLLLCSTPARALVFEPGVGAGLRYTDNAALDPDNEKSDLVAIGNVGARIEQNSGFFSANAAASLRYENYTDNTFDDKYYFNLGAGADWAAVRERLNVYARNNFSQRAVNSIDADTPRNSQDTNVFTTGPSFTFPISGRQTLLINPEYRNFYYEESDTDNQVYALNAVWSYQLYPETSLSLNGTVSKTVYDDEDRNPNFTINRIHVGMSGSRGRSEYTLNLGATRIKRDVFGDNNGFTGSLNWMTQLTGFSKVNLYLASELRSSSSGLLNSINNPSQGDFSNEQISGDVVQNDILRVEYSRDSATLATSLWVEWRNQDYKESPDDRKVREIGVSLKYVVTPLIIAKAYGEYNGTRNTVTDRDDDRYSVGGGITYNLSRKLKGLVDVRYRNKDSNIRTVEYSETSVLFSLVYGFSTIAHTSTR